MRTESRASGLIESSRDLCARLEAHTDGPLDEDTLELARAFVRHAEFIDELLARGAVFFKEWEPLQRLGRPPKRSMEP